MSEEIRKCNECGCHFLSVSPMHGLCPECAHRLHGQPVCQHEFIDGQCIHCGEDAPQPTRDEDDA